MPATRTTINHAYKYGDGSVRATNIMYKSCTIQLFLSTNSRGYLATRRQWIRTIISGEIFVDKTLRK